MFQPGQSGNPAGTQKQKRFLAALERAIAQDDSKRLRDAADKLLEEAANGQPWAIQMLADRLDGKVAQQINHAGHDGESLVLKVTPADAEA